MLPYIINIPCNYGPTHHHISSAYLDNSSLKHDKTIISSTCHQYQQRFGPRSSESKRQICRTLSIIKRQRGITRSIKGSWNGKKRKRKLVYYEIWRENSNQDYYCLCGTLYLKYYFHLVPTYIHTLLFLFSN